jgi:3-oxoadipate enol-lactonase
MTVYYTLLEQAGEYAPWLTMVHGFSHNQTYFHRAVAEFQADYRLLLVDFRGHGGSAKLPGPYGIEEYTDDVVAALDAAGIDKTYYWGTHTGAAIGLMLAFRQPNRLQSLVLESATLPGFNMPKVNELLDHARTIAQSQGIDAARCDWLEHADWFAYIQTHPERCRAAEHTAMVQKFEGAPWLSMETSRPLTSLVNQLAAIQLPVCLYNGEQDLPDFHRAAAEIEKGLTHVERHLIPEAGGFAAWENPQAVHPLVRRFLSDS